MNRVYSQYLSSVYHYALCTASENGMCSKEVELANCYCPEQPVTIAMAAGPPVMSVPSSSTQLSVTGKLVFTH